MLNRTFASRPLFRAVSSCRASVARFSVSRSGFKAQLSSSHQSVRLTTPPSFALSLHRPLATALVRYASTVPSKTERDDKPAEEDIDMMAGIRNDMKTIKDTFSLRDVPKEALYFGIAGVVPYLATSLETVYLAWEMNNASTTGSGFLISGESAELMLHIIEPLQIGYGAVILSFLGAIHWGLEWAGYGGKHGIKRYMTGCIAPAVAWPTLLFPIEHALISQFLAFVFLYYNDARAAARGWAPHWYGMYRFVLTFIVGGSIVASLIGRERISQAITSKHTLAEQVQALLFLRKKEIEEAKRKALEEKAVAEE